MVANWKMNPQTLKDAEKIFTEIAKASKQVKNASVVVCAPFVFLSDLKKKKKGTKISLGAQNTSSEPSGAYTGEVSVGMLADMGVEYVILGHSERRAGGSPNDSINKKVLITLKNKLTPILCVGETLRSEGESYLLFVKKQLTECLLGVPKTQMKKIVIAYEPVWAVGKDAAREATVEEFTEMRIFIKKVLADLFDAKTAHDVQVLYGGSVHPDNAWAFLALGSADGFLVGRDSLNPKKFATIITSADKK